MKNPTLPQDGEIALHRAVRPDQVDLAPCDEPVLIVCGGKRISEEERQKARRKALGPVLYYLSRFGD